MKVKLALSMVVACCSLATLAYASSVQQQTITCPSGAVLMKAFGLPYNGPFPYGPNSGLKRSFTLAGSTYYFNVIKDKGQDFAHITNIAFAAATLNVDHEGTAKYMPACIYSTNQGYYAATTTQVAWTHIAPGNG